MSFISQYQPNLSGLAYQKYKLKSSYLSIKSAKSLRSLNSQVKTNIHWWQKRPILNDALYTSLQKGSYHVAIFMLIETFLQILFSSFNIYTLFCAKPGSRYFRNLGFSFIFVYTGNRLVRWSLILCSFLLIATSIYLIYATIVLLKGLKNENELKFRSFIKGLAVFILLRFIILIYETLVNDLFYFYHQLNLALWSFLILIDFFAFLIVYSNYQELNDLTKLQDFAKEKYNSMNISRSIHDTSGISMISTSNNLPNDQLPKTNSFNPAMISMPESCNISESSSYNYNKQLNQQKQQYDLQQEQLKQDKLNKLRKEFGQLTSAYLPSLQKKSNLLF